MIKLKYLFIFTILTGFIACGGSSSNNNNDGIIVEGQLTQGAVSDHSAKFLRHGENEPIEEVEVCALGECSVTDGQGQFGFRVSSEFTGGDILFSIKGHGIDTTSVVSVPNNAKEVFVHFEHSANVVIVHHMMVNGQEHESEEHTENNDHTHEDNADHAH